MELNLTSHLELRFFLSSLSPHIFVYLIYYDGRPVRKLDLEIQLKLLLCK